jgi:ABC-type multidrug transport system fused ATPase/permease subunit
MTVGSLALVNTYAGQVTSVFNSIGDLFKTSIELNLDLWRVEFLLTLKPKLNDQKLTDEINLENVESISIQGLQFKYPQMYEEEKNYFDTFKQKLGFDKSQKTKKNFFQKIIDYVVPKWKNDELNKELDELVQVFDTNSALANKLVLHNINLTLEKGNIYALVGKNGSGKTTLVNLIKRGLDPTNGAISCNDTNIRSIRREKWRSIMASVEQNTINFNGLLNVREAILLNVDRKVSDEQIFDILTELEIADKFNTLDDVLGEGIQLSGGQKQLLEIARVLIAQKPINFLDEGTNQLDANKEKLVIKLMQKYLKDSITVFITHRMSTCKNCNYVIALRHGVVEAIDKPATLINSDKNTIFKEFWEMQMSL